MKTALKVLLILSLVIVGKIAMNAGDEYIIKNWGNKVIETNTNH